MGYEHSTLTGSDVHEPKGADTAAARTVYFADGAGSGTWEAPSADINNANLMTLNTMFADISTASSCFVVSPVAGDIVSIHIVLHGAITVANSTVTAKIGGVAVTGISITVGYSGSAAGSKFSGTASGSKTLAAGDAIEIVTDGASSTAAVATVTVLVNVA